MGTLTHRTPELPWANNKQESLFKTILVVSMLFFLALGLVVPNITLPDIKREALEKLPPQLAKVIKRKKEVPKPKVKPAVKEKKIEKVEVKKPDKVKPKPVVVAKPKPKPKRVSKKERAPDRVKAAKAKAKKLIENFANDLADMQNMVDMSTLAVDSSLLDNAGSAATVVGSVIDQTAVNRVGGIDDSKLTRETGAQQLAVADRNITEVKALPKDSMASTPADVKIAGMARSKMQLRRVFEQSKSKFDRIYRKALRSNPALEGTVTLGVTVAPNGDVTKCHVKSSDLQDKRVEKRITLTCKRLSFDVASAVDVFEYPLAFSP